MISHSDNTTMNVGSDLIENLPNSKLKSYQKATLAILIGVFARFRQTATTVSNLIANYIMGRVNKNALKYVINRNFKKPDIKKFHNLLSAFMKSNYSEIFRKSSLPIILMSIYLCLLSFSKIAPMLFNRIFIDIALGKVPFTNIYISFNAIVLFTSAVIVMIVVRLILPLFKHQYHNAIANRQHHEQPSLVDLAL